MLPIEDSHHTIALLHRCGPVLRETLAALQEFLPPQIPEDELLAHLVIQALDQLPPTASEPVAQELLWQAGLCYLRSHPLVRAAIDFLGLGPASGITDPLADLRAAAMALTLLAQLPLRAWAEARPGLLASALASLPAEQHLAMALHFYGGLAPHQIAGALGLSSAEAAALFSDALHQLALALTAAVLGRPT